MIRALQGEADLQSAQPNFRFRLAQAAGVSQAVVDGFSVQYAPAKLHLPRRITSAPATGRAGRGDRFRHRPRPSRSAGVVAGSFDALGNAEKPHPHGTAIAGAIAAHARLMGAAPAARILAIRAFGAAGASAEATTSAILKGIEYAVVQHARIINMSFAGPADPALVARSSPPPRPRASC